MREIKRNLIEIEKHLELDPNFSIEKMKFNVPSDKFNVVMIGDSLEDPVPRLLSLNQNSQMLSIDNYRDFKRHFKVWAESENPHDDRMTDE